MRVSGPVVLTRPSHCIGGSEGTQNTYTPTKNPYPPVWWSKIARSGNWRWRDYKARRRQRVIGGIKWGRRTCGGPDVPQLKCASPNASLVDYLRDPAQIHPSKLSALSLQPKSPHPLYPLCWFPFRHTQTTPPSHPPALPVPRTPVHVCVHTSSLTSSPSFKHFSCLTTPYWRAEDPDDMPVSVAE
jgi:hypothetical protein